MKHFLSLFLAANALVAVCQDLSGLYQQVNPAVVVILTEEQDLAGSGSATQAVTAEGLGSGFLISENQVLTAAHVVQVAESVRVEFLDGEAIPAKVVAVHKSSDVALLQLTWKKKNVQPLKLGNSDELKVGERIFIVGAPYGLDHSLSSGYVSGFMKDRMGNNPFVVEEFIQTDAAINHGNSGGPMFNLKGEVVGIVSYILSESGGFDGIGFAATSNITQEVLLSDQSKSVWSGMDGIPLTGKMARLFNVPQRSGFLVQKVVFLSPFGMMGLRGGDTKIKIDRREVIVGGDIILAINDVTYDETDEALVKIGNIVATLDSDDPLTLTVLRGGKIVMLERK